MNSRTLITAGALITLMLAGLIFAQNNLVAQGSAQEIQIKRETVVAPVMIAKRSTLAIKYRVDNDTKVNMVGSALAPKLKGQAEVVNKDGRSRIELELSSLDHPQRLGAFYTTYILWAVAPEGQAENLAALPVKDHINMDVTTSFQTFGLVITAEPHGAVTLPSPIIIAENALRKGTKGGIESSQIDYRGDTGDLYTVNTAGKPVGADFNTPLLILGARRSVEIAQRAHAKRFAEAEFREAELKLAALEQAWPKHHEEKYAAMARDVQRLGEHARTVAMDRAEQARLEAERRHADRSISEARTEAELAKAEAERKEREAALANQQATQAQTEAERAKAAEDAARLEAEHARQLAEQARKERDDLQQRLYMSLSAILETRREARGLIVNLSDVLFDFNQATLKPGAREKLSKLSGILLAYPGNYRMEIEGHTDAVGSDEYNLKLSQARAETVRNFLAQA
ncbi:MAG TPA: OmpA family protein, partial [Blastocatellia bacterium]|nr:OmpA family protein [Blastocatellia bacterium]